MTNYRNVEVFASDDDRPGFLRLFAKVNGSIVPIAEAKSGHLEQFSRSPVALAVKKQDDEKAAAAESPPEAPSA